MHPVSVHPAGVAPADAGLVAALVVAAYAYARGARRLRDGAGPRALPAWHIVMFAAGWAAVAGAMLPPLRDATESSLAAHMVQHELLIVIAAPLLVVGRAPVAMLWALPQSVRARARAVLSAAGPRFMRHTLASPLVVWSIAAALFWMWHVPPVFKTALESEALHAVEHLCFFGGALASWWVALHGRYGRLGYGAAALWLFVTALHSSLLGGLLTVSPRLWYGMPAGELVPLRALEDQQLAGLLMWVPGGVLHAAAGLALIGAWLREAGRRLHGAAGLCSGDQPWGRTVTTPADGDHPGQRFAKTVLNRPSASAANNKPRSRSAIS